MKEQTPGYLSDHWFDSETVYEAWHLSKDGKAIVSFAEDVTLKLSRKLGALAELFNVIASSKETAQLDTEQLGGMCELLEDGQRDLKLVYQSLQDVFTLRDAHQAKAD